MLSVATALVLTATSGTSRAIINGTSSPAAQDYVVQIAIEKDGKRVPFCTATLVAKNLVITARHCTGELSDDEESITSFSPAKLAFYFGTGAGPRTIDEEPDAFGKTLFTNGRDDLEPDIALVELDRAVTLPIAPIRLDGGATLGETVDVVGYGLTEDHLYPSVRQQRKGLEIATVGPGETDFFALNEGEFQFGEAACAGDSGGPALSSSTGAIVGIASRVTNGEERSETKVASFCMGSKAEDIYTDLTPARAFIEDAFAAVGAEPWIEGEPTPEEKAAQRAEEERQAAASQAAAESGCAVRPPRALPGELPAVAPFGVLLFAGALRRRSRRRLRL